MNETELFQRAGLAIAIGLLVGIERGWQEREAKSGSRVAGIRTFTLVGALGGLSALLPGDLTLALCFLGFALPYGFFEWQRARASDRVSATGFVAGLLTFALGAYAIRGNMALAAAGGVVAAAVLAERHILHAFLRRLKWLELRAALLLLAMTVVLIPILPDRTIDPWNALNPREIWLMTLMVGAVSYGGYIAVRVAGMRRGLLLAAIMGGIATSTTVTWTFARLARHKPAAMSEVSAAILAAWVVSLLRMSALAVVVAPQLLIPLAAPIAAASSLLFIMGALAYRAAGKTESGGLVIEDPFDLSLMLRFTVLLSAIMLLARTFSGGESGLFALGAISGFLDVDPITLSMAKMANADLPAFLAVSTILIAATTNGLAKSVLAIIFGGWRLGLRLSGAAILAFCAGVAAHLSGPWF